MAFPLRRCGWLAGSLASIAVLAAGCGGDPSPTGSATAAAADGASAPAGPGEARARPAARADAAVIRRWANALRRGRIARATDAFTIPAVVSNSGPPITLRSADEIAVFNLTLPCGARLERAVDVGRYVTATFMLTERAGPGAGCGEGAGRRAYVAFGLRGGRIAAWRRVAGPADRPSRGAPDLPPVQGEAA